MSDKTPAQRHAPGTPDRPYSNAFATWLNAMTIEAELPDAAFDPRDVLGAIMAAESWEQALERADSTLASGKNLIGWPHTIHDFRLVKSDERYAQNEGSLGVYAVVNATGLEDRDERVYGVGAANVLAILWQARQFGRLPGDFVIVSRETANGELLSLRPVGARTVKTQPAEAPF